MRGQTILVVIADNGVEQRGEDLKEGRSKVRPLHKEKAPASESGGYKGRGWGHLKVAATRRSIWTGGTGGDWGGFADGVAVDYEFYAAVALAAFGGVVGGYRLGFAEAAGGHGAACHALFG